MFARRVQDQLPRRDQALLIRQSYRLASANRCVRSLQPRDTHNRRYDKRSLGQGRDPHRSLSPVNNFHPANARMPQSLLEGIGQFFRRQRHQLWPPSDALLKRGLQIAASRKRDYLVPVRKGFADGESALADGAGRAQDGELFHYLYFLRLRSYLCILLCRPAQIAAPQNRPRLSASFSSSTHHSTGVATSNASMRSRMPPCPGNSLPESLTPALRFIADSSRSQSCAAILMIAAS